MKQVVWIISLVFCFSSCNFKTNQNKPILVGDSLITNIYNIDSIKSSLNIEQTIDSISICLPYPNETFFKLKQSRFNIDDSSNLYSCDDIYLYLITNLDSTESKIIYANLMYSNEATHWGQHFKNDVFYIYHDNLETGADYSLYTHCKNKSEFFKTISAIIEFQELDSTYYNPEMIWNEDSTRYEPIEQEAGCYYEISKDSVENYMLNYYCGC